ncbi:MAG: aminotransferase class I/II-fold pyridoxal phosphate-dependent enzyme [Candidatus Eisenbacteria bacterium]
MGGRAAEPGPRPEAAARVRGFGTSIFAEMTRLANLHGAVNLAQGFPDFAGPDFLKREAIAAIEADHNQYARMAGLPALAESVTRHYEARHRLHYDPLAEVTITAGATEAIHCAFLALCDPGDEVVMLEPTYDSYLACCAMAGATARVVTLRAPQFTWDPAELRSAFSPRTKMVLLNTPHNPTGRVLTAQELEEVATLCLRHGAVCVTDEVYDRLVYAGEHRTIAALPGMRERTLVINSTRRRSASPAGGSDSRSVLAFSAALQAVHQFVTFAVATRALSARDGARSIGRPRLLPRPARRVSRRDLLSAGLEAAGLTVYRPEDLLRAGRRAPLGWRTASPSAAIWSRRSGWPRCRQAPSTPRAVRGSLGALRLLQAGRDPERGACSAPRSQAPRDRSLTAPVLTASSPAMSDPKERQELRERLAFARTIAHEAAAIALGYFRASGTRWKRRPTSPR